jgi:glutathione S-transferase
MKSKLELIGLYFSPWTERARWALDYHGVRYQYREYTTLLDELSLRLKTKRPFDKITVPLLIADQELVNDSFEIARFADRQSDKRPLIPATHLDEIREWVDWTELALCSARIRATRRIMASPEALADRLPGYIPDFLRMPLAPMSFLGSGLILFKYRLKEDSDEQLHRNLHDFLKRASLALKDGKFVFSELSFADLLIATMLQAIKPIHAKYIKLNEASMKCMNESELASEYAPLVAWRDNLYENFR